METQEAEEIIGKREADIKKIILKKKEWLQYLFLAIILWIGAYIRTRPLHNLIDQTTGKYITIELDSTLWLRYAKEIVENGVLFKIDPLRAAPIGANLSELGTFTAYFIAYLYKVLSFFSSTISIEYVANIYPVVTTIITTIFLFLLVRRLFDWRVAALSALFLNTLPSFLFRSLGGSSDHDALGMMFFIMTIYFYIAGFQSKSWKNNLLLGLIAGFLTIFGRETAGLTNFLFLIISITLLMEALFDKLTNKDYLAFLGWASPILAYIIIFGNLGGIKTLATSITTTPLLLTILFIIVMFISKNSTIKKLLRLKEPYESAQMILYSLVLASIIGFIFLGANFITRIPSRILGALANFTSNRWVTTVAENHIAFVADWFGQMGKTYFYLFILGSILLFFKTTKTIGVLKKRIMLTAPYAIFLTLFIFSKYSSNSKLNGDSTLSHVFFYGSIIGFAIFIFVSWYLVFPKGSGELRKKVKDMDKSLIFLIFWFTLVALAATTAIRFLFEFTPITTVLASFCLVYIFDFFWLNKKQYIKWIGTLFIVLLLFAPSSYGLISKYYTISLNQANGSGPGYHLLWQQAGKWTRENTQENAIFAHWWDYGYWVQSGFERATITDGGNFIGWWNYLVARDVLTTDDPEKALKFLYAHNANYLLAVADDIGKYPAYSLIGSDENYDRLSSITTFSLDLQNSQETRNGTMLVYRGGAALDENLVYNEVLYPAGSAGIAEFFLPLSTENGQTRILQPTAVIVYNSQQINVPINCLYIENQKLIFENGLNACIAIIPILNPDSTNKFGALLYLSNKVSKSLFSRMYIGGETISGFKLVYDSEGQVPLGIYNGGLNGPIRIWEIDYPPNITLTDEEKQYYLQENYLDVKLTELRK